MGLADFLFGAGPLKKAAATPPATPANTPQPASVGISQSDIAGMAQQQADANKAAKAKSPAGQVNVKNPATHQDKLDHN